MLQAPMSARMRTSQALSGPARLAPMRPSAIWARPGWVLLTLRPLHHDLGLGEARVEIAADELPLMNLVSAELVVEDRRSVLERSLRIGHDRERVILDHDLLGGVDDRVAVLPED